MKKIVILLLSILLLTGCSLVNIKDSDINEIINKVLIQDIDLHNNVFNGYKIYVPRGLKVNEKNDYNLRIVDGKSTFYVYIDIVSYYYKNHDSFVYDTDSIISKELSFNNKAGYINIKEIDDKYYVKYLYNYAKIEAYVEKENLNMAVLNMSYILNSVEYNDTIIDTIIGENVLDYKEEKVDLFTSKRENGNFLEYIEKYDTKKYEQEEDNQDILEYDTNE